MQQILVVDDEMGIRELLSEILSEEGYTVRLAENASEARAYRSRTRPDLVLLDIWMPDTDGITLLKEWASAGLLTMPVVMMSGHGTIDTAVQATRIGAFDFLEKPIALQKLLATVGRALKHGGEQPQASLSLAALGRAAVVNELKQRLERVANLRTPVLLLAEPGCGIELCARFLHARNTPWLALEATGRLAEAPLDLLAQAREGTLFVHEVGELTRVEQKGLLLLISKLDRYNARVVAGATRHLADLVAAGAFDSRLYAALSATTIRVPTLREHREDVPDIANLVLSQMIEAKEVPPREFSTAALNALRNYDWPGNLIQLQTSVQTLAQTALGEQITLEDVERTLPQADPARQRVHDQAFELPLRDARDAFERVYFEYHIAKEGGNISRVADTVGLERTHLYRKLKQLGIRVTRKMEES
ncbi:MAG: two component, sigma54 specific, transcriptional regulator, Fis family [Betaproteobacteria bacterium]|jgi:two-component system nitrogen regulation response regulator NtrX|nr:two component, sigma54 specific, transcriptional regulator, Fis family [Betaproteobacteria bacterium]